MNGITHKFLNELTFEVIGCAIEVQKTMGRGLFESVYHKCMIEELKLRKINFHSELKIPVTYKNINLELDFRCDLYIENCLVLEIKSVNELINIHEAQLLNYMNLLKAPKGILLNFNSQTIFKEGQKTFVNDYFKKLDKE
jgi:GxxExxY protein